LNRKETIIKTATRLFAKKGFYKTSTIEIAEKAGVAHGTIFYHFKNKEGILYEIIKRSGDNYIEEIKAAVAHCKTGIEKIETILRFNDAFSVSHSQQLLIYLRDLPEQLTEKSSPIRSLMESIGNQVISVIYKSIKAGVKDNSITTDNAHDTAFLIYSLNFGLFHMKLISPMDVPDLKKCATDFCRNALSTSINSKTACKEPV
jgi:AcrR family transcriptional regulator